MNEALKSSRREAKIRARSDAGTGDAESDSFTKRLLTNLINSLQIYIDQVRTSLFLLLAENHQVLSDGPDLRYEDDTTVPGQSFSAGVTLNKLHGKSTDEKWEPSLSSSLHSKFIFKLLQLQDLSVYWNPQDELLIWNTPEELAAAMARLIPKQRDPSSKMDQETVSHSCS